MASNDYSYTFLQPVRGVWLTLFEPKAFLKDGKPKGDPKYGGTFLLPASSPELDAIKQVLVAAARSKWPTRKIADLTLPLASGDREAEKAAAKGKDGSFFAGQIVLKARSKFPPVLSMLSNGRVMALDNDVLRAQGKAKFYSGCYVAPQVNFVPYEGTSGPDGVTAYLQAVLWVKDGERIAGGGADPAEVFKSYMGQSNSFDPTGADAEIPF